jgi:hypothetical protein
MKAAGICPVCEINIYEIAKGIEVKFRGRTIRGYPNPVSMPCGINRENHQITKDLTAEQVIRCPFETAEQQSKIDMQKAVGIFSGRNNYE